MDYDIAFPCTSKFKCILLETASKTKSEELENVTFNPFNRTTPKNEVIVHLDNATERDAYNQNFENSTTATNATVFEQNGLKNVKTKPVNSTKEFENVISKPLLDAGNDNVPKPDSKSTLTRHERVEEYENITSKPISNEIDSKSPPTTSKSVEESESFSSKPLFERVEEYENVTSKPTSAEIIENDSKLPLTTHQMVENMTHNPLSSSENVTVISFEAKPIDNNPPKDVSSDIVVSEATVDQDVPQMKEIKTDHSGISFSETTENLNTLDTFTQLWTTISEESTEIETENPKSSPATKSNQVEKELASSLLLTNSTDVIEDQDDSRYEDESFTTDTSIELQNEPTNKSSNSTIQHESIDQEDLDELEGKSFKPVYVVIMVVAMCVLFLSFITIIFCVSDHKKNPYDFEMKRMENSKAISPA